MRRKCPRETKWTSRCTTNRRKSSLLFTKRTWTRCFTAAPLEAGRATRSVGSAGRCRVIRNACLFVQAHVSGAGADADSDDAFHRAQGIGQIHGEHTPDETGQRECAPFLSFEQRGQGHAHLSGRGDPVALLRRADAFHQTHVRFHPQPRARAGSNEHRALCALRQQSRAGLGTAG